MFKTALFDCAINEKCRSSVNGGRGICLFFRPRRGGFDSSRVPTTPGNFPSKAKKIQMPGCQCLGVSPDVCVCGGGGGGPWAQLELTDTKTSQMWISSNSLEIEVGSSNNDIACLLSSLFLIVDCTFLFSCGM